MSEGIADAVCKTFDEIIHKHKSTPTKDKCKVYGQPSLWNTMKYEQEKVKQRLFYRDGLC